MGVWGHSRTAPPAAATSPQVVTRWGQEPSTVLSGCERAEGWLCVGPPQTSVEPPGASVLPEIPLCSWLGLSTEPCTSPLGSAAVSGRSLPLGLRCHLPVLPPPCMGTVPTCPSSPGNRSHPAPSPGHRTSPIGATPTGILAAPLVILFISSLFLCFFGRFCVFLSFTAEVPYKTKSSYRNKDRFTLVNTNRKSRENYCWQPTTQVASYSLLRILRD